MKKVVFIGLGYIGLPTAAMFAKDAFDVTGVDIKAEIIESVNSGASHIEEPGLSELIKDVHKRGKLKAQHTIPEGDIFIIAVPTPFNDDITSIPQPDTSYVETAIISICPILKKGNTIILESTSPVGTTEKIAKIILKNRPDLKVAMSENDTTQDIFIAYCPERILPGNALRELEQNDRIIGGLSFNCGEKAAEVYRAVIRGKAFTTTARTAELAKLAENAYRDVQIAFANELSQICDSLKVDVWELISLANRHPRVDILSPGAGVGGHCIAVDPWFIVSQDPSQARLIHQARLTNIAKENWVISKISKIQKLNQGKDIICMGLSYKPNIDDLRESPSLRIFNELKSRFGDKVKAIEPNIKKNTFHDLIDFNDTDKSSSIYVALVKHDEFKTYDLTNAILIDVCGLEENK